MVLLIVFPFALQCCSHRFRSLYISLLCTLGTARKQNDDACAVLDVVNAPARAKSMRSSMTLSPTALKSPSKPKESRLMRAAIAARTLLSFNSSSHAVNSGSGLTENMLEL
jgi:hypothetical protein